MSTHKAKTQTAQVSLQNGRSSGLLLICGQEPIMQQIRRAGTSVLCTHSLCPGWKQLSDVWGRFPSKKNLGFEVYGILKDGFCRCPDGEFVPPSWSLRFTDLTCWRLSQERGLPGPKSPTQTRIGGLGRKTLRGGRQQRLQAPAGLAFCQGG